MKLWVSLLVLLASSCGAVSEGGAARSEPTKAGLGSLSIGDVPKDLSGFSNSDCDARGLSDCTANDAQGRRYVFFDGALSRISIKRGGAAQNLTLPAGVVFGESIDLSKEKAAAYYRVSFDRGVLGKIIIYSSGFEIESSSGVLYSLELISDDSGKLEEVVQRTDF